MKKIRLIPRSPRRIVCAALSLIFIAAAFAGGMTASADGHPDWYAFRVERSVTLCGVVYDLGSVYHESDWGNIEEFAFLWAEVCGYDGDAEEVTVPADVNGYPVKGVRSGAFTGASFRKITLPDSLEVIEYGSFVDCKNLEVIDLGKGPDTYGSKVWNSRFDFNIPLGSICSGCDALKEFRTSPDNPYYTTGKYGELIYKNQENAFLNSVVEFPAAMEAEVCVPERTTYSLGNFSGNNDSLKYMVCDHMMSIYGDYLVGTNVIAVRLSRNSALYINSNKFGGPVEYDSPVKYVFFEGTEKIWNTEIHSYGTVTRAESVKDPDVKVIFDAKDAAKVFSDVSADSWFYGYVDFAMNLGLMKGVSGTEFAPDAPMSRAMLVTVLWRLEGSPDAAAAPFSDLSEQWYETAVGWAYENGIVMGATEEEFDPDGDVTREQISAILKRYAEYKEMDTSASAPLDVFSDSERIEEYARDPMSWAVGCGLVKGVTSAKLDPAGRATRAQVATMLMRVLSIG